MKPGRNALLYLGFLIVLAAFQSYFLLFVRFPATRDIPWVNFLLFALGLGLLATGVVRAYSKPKQYRGKISAPILAGISVLIVAFFLVITFSLSKHLPTSHGAPQVGQKAPDFTLPDKDGNPITLSKLWKTSVNPSPGGQTSQWVLLIFYRGYW